MVSLMWTVLCPRNNEIKNKTRSVAACRLPTCEVCELRHHWFKQKNPQLGPNKSPQKFYQWPHLSLKGKIFQNEVRRTRTVSSWATQILSKSNWKKTQGRRSFNLLLGYKYSIKGATPSLVYFETIGFKTFQNRHF